MHRQIFLSVLYYQGVGTYRHVAEREEAADALQEIIEQW
jgi:hypothetical protein